MFDMWRLAFNALTFCGSVLAMSNEGPIFVLGHLKARPATATDCLAQHFTGAGITQRYCVSCVKSGELGT